MNELFKRNAIILTPGDLYIVIGDCYFYDNEQSTYANIDMIALDNHLIMFIDTIHSTYRFKFYSLKLNQHIYSGTNFFIHGNCFKKLFKKNRIKNGKI